jgi:hypothetical protein
MCVEECGAVKEVESVYVERLFHVFASSSCGRGKDCTAFSICPWPGALLQVISAGWRNCTFTLARFARTSIEMSLRKMWVTPM